VDENFLLNLEKRYSDDNDILMLIKGYRSLLYSEKGFRKWSPKLKNRGKVWAAHHKKDTFDVGTNLK